MKRAGDEGKGKGRKRDSRLFPLPIVPRAYFSVIAILLRYPAVASADEREKERSDGS